MNVKYHKEDNSLLSISLMQDKQSFSHQKQKTQGFISFSKAEKKNTHRANLIVLGSSNVEMDGKCDLYCDNTSWEFYSLKIQATTAPSIMLFAL